MPSVCPTQVAGRGLAYQRGQGGVVSWAASFPQAGSMLGQLSACPQASTEKSSVVGSCEQRAVDVETFGLILRKPNEP